MFARYFARPCRVLALGLLMATLGRLGQGTRADEPPKPEAAAWTFDEAVGRLVLSPRDPYLQYVVLQLGRREGREQEAVAAIDRPNILARSGLFGNDRGRRSRVDLFATFTGALAIQESLQLDTMRGDRPAAAPLAQVRPPGSVPPPPKPPLPEKVAVNQITGPTVPSHPWEKLLGAKKPDVGPLAGFVPEEFYFAEFASAAKLNEVLGAGELWAGHIFTQALGDARSQLTAERVKKQLGLFAMPPGTIDRLGVEAVAVTGSDLFLSEGSDVTLLVKGRNIPALARLADAGAGKVVSGEYLGVPYTHRSTKDGAVNAYAASPLPDLHVRGNSLPAFKRVLEAVVGKAADGKPARRLGESAEFRYVRSRMPRGAAEENGFVYLSDAFIRRLVGPQLKLTERRRVLAYNHLRMIGHAALLFRTEHGRPPKSLEELATAQCAPGVFGKGGLAHPDGGTYSLTEDGMAGVCSRYGRADALTPCVERLVTEVTGAEAEEYRQFVAEYSQYWREYFDPIAVRIGVTAKQYRLETLVLPLIDNSIYTALARGAGRPAAMDLLPTPKREIGGLWVHFDKQPLLDALGPDQAKDPPHAAGEAGASRPAAEAARASNALKRIGLAFHNYDAVANRLPGDVADAAGKPLLSWRVAILPYIEQQKLYEQFKLDEPWDSEHNKKLIEKIPAVYAGPVSKPQPKGKTPYLRPVGKGTLFPPDKKMKLVDVTDGTSNTIMAVEVSGDAAVVWTKPDDLAIDPKQPSRGLTRAGQKSFLALLADGSVRAIPADIDSEMLARAFDPADGRPVNLEAPKATNSRPKTPFEVPNDLKQIGLAMHSYHDANGLLPTTNVRDKDGKPLLSWRVAILPYVEQEALYRQFHLDEPWDSKHNKALVEKMPRIYYGPDAKLNAAGKTAYLIPAGKGTLSPPDGTKRTLESITDGTANTVLAVAADPGRSVTWTKPDDLPFDPKDPLRGLARPGQDYFDVLMADGRTIRVPAQVNPTTWAAAVTPDAGEVAQLTPRNEAPPAVSPLGVLGGGLGFSPELFSELESYGVDLNKLRRFLRDGIGDQVGFHTHDAPRLLDSDLSGLFGKSDGAGNWETSLGLLLRFVFGPSSVSIPVKDPKAVDEYLEEIDRLILARRQDIGGHGIRWNQEVDFYRVAFPSPHTIRCLGLNLFGLKWRVYWGRIGDGLYVATRPFILEDIAAAHAAGARPAKSEPAHAVLRVRPENWREVLAGFNLGWAEGHRTACHANLDMVANVNRGWNDRRPAAGSPDAELLGRVVQVYGARPFCPDGGSYTLAANGRACRCSIHGDNGDPRQPAGPTDASSTGRLLKSFAGLTATVRFEEDGLRVIVTVDRKDGNAR